MNSQLNGHEQSKLAKAKPQAAVTLFPITWSEPFGLVMSSSPL